MADAQCILIWRMTKNITKVINEKEKMMLETAAHFISICYAPWALKFKSAFQIKDHYPRLMHAMLASMQHHFWNLPYDLVLLALADDDIELELKSKTFWLWSSCLFKIGKHDLPVVFMSRELSDLVVHRTGSFGKWLMFPNGVKEEKPISPLTLTSTL